VQACPPLLNLPHKWQPMTVQRTRTRPEIKWLANELAATAGELERIDEQMRRMSARKVRLLAVHAALSAVAGQMAVSELPNLVPNVKAHGLYGGRGNLKRWVEQMLQAVQPDAIDTVALAARAAEVFGLELGTSKEMARFRQNCIGGVLRKLLAEGLVERLHHFKGVPDMVGV
jgi:hypothetical protein